MTGTGMVTVVISVLREAAMSVRLVINAALILVLTTGASFAAGRGPTDTALVDAARAADWSSVRALVSKGLQREAVNAADTDGANALHWAVRADEVEIASLLIRSGVDVNAETRL